MTNIIVRMPNWIGDLIMATPVLFDLRSAFPDASITAMCREPLGQLLEQEKAIDEIFTFCKPQNKFARRQEKRDIIAKIRAGSFDLGILLTQSFSSAWWFWRGEVKRRIGYSHHWRRFLLSDALTDPIPKMHQVDLYKKLLEPLGIGQSKTKPSLCLDPVEMQEAKQLLLQSGHKSGTGLIGINPGAAYGSAKCWPPERFRELALRLLEKGEKTILFFGDAQGTSLVKEIVQGLPPRVIDLAGVTSLKKLACLIGQCSLLITNDSGPMHMAAALGTPLVALFGSTDPEKTGPYGSGQSVVYKKVTCSPCFRRTCPIDFPCMREISVDEVVEKVHRALALKGLPLV